MTAIERHQGAAIPDKLAYADALARADLLPTSYRGKAGNVLLAVEFGEMLGTHPLTAIQQVHVIDGKLSASAELMRALALRAGHKVRVLRHDAEAATVAIVRVDDPDHTTETTFTMEDARRAGLLDVWWERWVESDRGRKRKDTWVIPAAVAWPPTADDLARAGAPEWVMKQGPGRAKRKDNWHTYPGPMLLARATSAAVRAVCPEVLMGVSYTPEELGAPVDATGEVIDVGEVVGSVTVGEAKRRVLAAVNGDTDRAREAWSHAFPQPVLSVAEDELVALLALLEAPAEPPGESSLPMGEPDDPARDDGVVAEPPRGGHEAGEEVAATEGMGVPAAASDPVPDDEIIDGELVDDEAPPDASGSMTQAQNRKLHVLMAKAGASGPDRHHMASDMLGRRIESMKDVTKAEAARMIDRLEADEDPFEGFPKDAA